MNPGDRTTKKNHNVNGDGIVYVISDVEKREVQKHHRLESVVFRFSQIETEWQSRLCRRRDRQQLFERPDRVRQAIRLSVIRHFSNAEIPKAIKHLLCAAVRITIAGPPAGTLEQHIAAVAPQIGPKGIMTTKDLAVEMLKEDVVPGDAKFRDGVTTARVSKESLARYYLRALEHAKAGESKPWHVSRDEAKGTLEHILPKSKSKDWGIPEDEAKAV